MGDYDKVRKFIENGGLIDAGRPPGINEPFYSLYMKEKIRCMNLVPGDRVKLAVKYRDADAVEIKTGILINDTSLGTEYVEILTQGRKVWTSRKNDEIVHTHNILFIEKLSDAPSGFDIYNTNPHYRSAKEWLDIFVEDAKKVHAYTEKDEEVFKKIYPGKTLQDTKVLSLHFDLYWNFIGDVKSARITIVNKELCKMYEDEAKIKHIYPNRNYFTACGHEKDSEYVLFALSDEKELEQIKYISCLWTVDIEDGMECEILAIIYPEFCTLGKPYNIYPLGMRVTPMQNYTEDFYKPSVFLERIFADYDHSGLLYTKNGEYTLISGHKPDRQDMELIQNISERDKKTDYIEYFISDDVINSNFYFSPSDNKLQNRRKREERIDFSRFLSDSFDTRE